MSFSEWGTITLTFIAVIMIWYYHEFFKLKRRMNNIKGPFPAPLIGSVLSFINYKTFLGVLTGLTQNYGKIVLLMLGVKPFLLITDYEAVQNILVSNTLLGKGFMYKFLQNWLNGGLSVSTGNKWKTRRRILTPAYHFQILEQFVPVFNRVSDVLIEQLKKNGNKKAINVYPYIALSTLDVICETAMGVSINAQIDKHSPYVKSVEEMMRIILERTFSCIQHAELTYRFTANYKIEQESLHIMNSYTESVIKQRRAEMALNELDPTKNENDTQTKKQIAFLDILLQYKDENGVPLSDTDIREEVSTFLFAGQNNPASGISFTLYEIAHNPDVQQKILKEQESILQGDNRDFTYNDLIQMKYLEMVIKEALRLYPPVPFYARHTQKPFQLTKDINVPAGCTLAISAYSMHRNPDVFPEPEKFDPERFSADNYNGKQPYIFLPFSSGPRNCIGKSFALLELKATISNILRRFELLPSDPLQKLNILLTVSLKPKNGVVIRLKERK